ncbi:MAG: hypothetical protein IT161_08495 [Bryobacterales bacterium]|nr:hypothetical protein [Bryobacterales bacterium]
MRRPKQILMLAALTISAVTAQTVSMAAMPDAFDMETAPSREIAVFNVRGGQVVLVEQLGGDIGFVGLGPRAMELLQTLVGEYDLSGLEVYEALGGNRNHAPAALIAEHQRRYAGNPAAMRGRPLPDVSSMAVAPMAANQSVKGQLGGAACVDGPQETFDYFTAWFNNYSGMFSGVGPLGNLGANHVSGTGIWNKGNVNVNLGSTSAGAVCVCFPEGYPGSPPKRVRVEERASQGTWVQIWSSNSLFTGAAYGYWFKGVVIRKIRLLVRDNEVHNGHAFYWAGSY